MAPNASTLASRFSLAALAVPLVALAACGPNNSGSTDTQCRALAATAAQRPAAWTGTVFTIVMENKSRGQILGNSGAPYVNGLAQANAVAAGYHDSYVHPSEPNYIWMVAGENFGILNDDDPTAANTIDSQSHLADQLERAGLTWKTYQESMGAPCGLQSHGTYAVKHNPFAYFTDVALLAGHRVPEGRAITNKVWETLAWTGIGRGFADQLRREAASLPDAAIPELTHVTASVAARLDSERSTAESLSAVHASNELTARQEP